LIGYQNSAQIRNESSVAFTRIAKSSRNYRRWHIFGIWSSNGVSCGDNLGLARPGSALDRIWNLNPRAHEELAPFGRVVGIPFLLLGATLAVASLGWFKRRRWGWQLAVAIIATQVLGDLVNIFRGDLLRGGIGFLIAGALLSYLLSAPQRPPDEPCLQALQR
jgi:hypothetical protein